MSVYTGVRAGIDRSVNSAVDGAKLDDDFIQDVVRNKKRGRMLVALLLRNAGRMVRDRRLAGQLEEA